MREKNFTLKNNLKLYWGFMGKETTKDERDWYRNKTILDGDLMGDDSTNIAQTQLLGHNSRDDNS